MANANATGFGLRMVMNLGNTPATQGQSEYKLKSGLGVGIYKNNITSIQDSSGDEGYLQDASFATTDDGGNGGSTYSNSGHSPIIGVFNGAYYVDNSTSKPTWANSVASGTTFGTDYNTGSSDGAAFVNDNPFQEYCIKADAAVTQAMMGDAGYNCTSTTSGGAYDPISGQSTVKLNISGGAAGTKMFKLVRSADDPDNKDLSAVNANVIVVQAAASNLYN